MDVPVYIVHAIVRRNFGGRSHSEYEDLVGDGLEGLWLAILSYDENKGSSYESWLWTQTHYHIINAWRHRHGRYPKQRRHFIPHEQVFFENLPYEGVEDEALRRVRREEIRRTIEGLSPMGKQIAKAMSEEGGQTRLAKKVGITEGGITRRKRKVLEELRKHLAEYND